MERDEWVRAVGDVEASCSVELKQDSRDCDRTHTQRGGWWFGAGWSCGGITQLISSSYLCVCVFVEGGQREDGRIGVFSSQRDL